MRENASEFDLIEIGHFEVGGELVPERIRCNLVMMAGKRFRSHGGDRRIQRLASALQNHASPRLAVQLINEMINRTGSIRVVRRRLDVDDNAAPAQTGRVRLFAATDQEDQLVTSNG